MRLMQYPTWHRIIIVAVVFLVFSFFAIKMPLYTYIDQNTIIVKQLIGSKSFKRNDINTQRISSADMKGTIRLFGSGGFLGYIGWFSNAQLGKFYMITMNKKDLLLITTSEGKKYVINYPISPIN
jgi:hypothetical protein